MKNNKGFTLIEVIVIVVILASLMAVAVPISMSYIDDVNEKKLISEVESIIYVAETTIHSNRSSLNGTYVEEGESTDGVIQIQDGDTLDHIVTKANGHGKIVQLSYKGDKVIEIKYEINGKTINYQEATGDYQIN